MVRSSTLTFIDPLSIAVISHVDPTAVYIGRQFAGLEASPLGNPFPLAKCANDAARDRMVAKYRIYLKAAIARVADGSGSAEDWAICQELDRLVALAKQGPIKLRCWCAPKACHGDVVAELVADAVRSGRVFCPDAAPPPLEATARSPTYGICWQCGQPKQIPGTDRFLCSGNCGWMSTTMPPRAVKRK